MTFSPSSSMTDFLVLSVIANGDAYGYQISQIIREAAPVKDSALYPVLKRMQENRYVETYDRQFQGRNRKYYRITASGKIRQKELETEWESYKTIVDMIIKGGNTDE